MSQNQYALITGATAGIGKATAFALAKAGYNLILTGRREERLQALRKELSSCKVEVVTAVFDVQNRAEVENFLNKNTAVLEKTSVLINNAGLAKGVDKMQQAKLEDWDTMIDTNIKGLLYLTRGLLPHMLKQQRGHIVNLGSVAGRWTYPGGAVYCATKFAVRALTDGLRMDLLGTPLRVSNIEPGMVNSEFSLARLGTQEAADKVYQGMTPLTPQDIAETVMWILQRPKHVNIQELVIFPTDQAAVHLVHRE